VGEVPYLREFIEQHRGNRVDDLLTDHQTTPKLVGAFEEYRTPSDVFLRGGMGASTSLPSDFWSTTVTKEVEVRQIDASQIQSIRNEISALYETDNDITADIESLWQDEIGVAEQADRAALLDESEQSLLEPEIEHTSTTTTISEVNDDHSITKDKS